MVRTEGHVSAVRFARRRIERSRDDRPRTSTRDGCDGFGDARSVICGFDGAASRPHAETRIVTEAPRETATEAPRHRENFFTLCPGASVADPLGVSVSLWRLSYGSSGVARLLFWMTTECVASRRSSWRTPAIEPTVVYGTPCVSAITGIVIGLALANGLVDAFMTPRLVLAISRNSSPPFL